MRRSSIYTSAVFHGIMLLIAVFGLPFFAHREFVIPPPITVDLVDISKVTQTDKVVPKPAPPKPEPPKPTPPTPQNTAQQPAPPVKTPPKPEEKKETSKAEEIDEAAPPKKEKKEPKKTQEAAKPQPQRDFSSVLKNLDVSKEPPAPPVGQNAPLGEKMTMSEADALRAQLEKCWDVPIGAKDIENMAIDIVMVINPDRTLREARVVDTGRYRSDAVFQSVADSALRAVRSPLCSPFQVPPDKYSVWNTVTVTFNPRDMF
jgi:outer membrane biosynthesis protein TonB